MAYQDPVEEQDLVQEQTDNPITLEKVLDKIAETLIMSAAVTPDKLYKNQKTIRQGLIKASRSKAEKLLLYESAIDANKEDLKTTNESGDTLTNIVEQLIGQMEAVQININLNENNNIQHIFLENGNQSWNITELLTKTIINEEGDEIVVNPLNISQFIDVNKIAQNVNPNLANEYLDTTIFELLPDSTARQEQINKFFDEFQNLIGEIPEFNVQNGLVDDNFDPNEYSEQHDISAAQDTPDYGIQESESFITRLNEDANSNNQGKTLQSLRDSLNEYLKDVDQQYPEAQDDRPVYENKSDGYLKFRNLNQGIIIRNIDKSYIDGLDPNTTDFLDTGFTITQWVRFTDKSSQGTLFNFGNPTRNDNPFGFKLETFVINRDEKFGVGTNANNTWYELLVDRTGDDWNYTTDILNANFFSDTETERFVRLVVREDSSTIWSSHMGKTWVSQRRAGCAQWGFSTINETAAGYTAQSNLILHPRIPFNPNEWYFICATYNPDIKEDESHSHANFGSFDNNFDFWMGHVNPDNLGTLIYKSGYGAKCKVEIISRTDLLRARGYKV